MKIAGKLLGRVEPHGVCHIGHIALLLPKQLPGALEPQQADKLQRRAAGDEGQFLVEVGAVHAQLRAQHLYGEGRVGHVTFHNGDGISNELLVDRRDGDL